MGGVDPELYNTYFYVEDISGEDGNECIISRPQWENWQGIYHDDIIIFYYSFDTINWLKCPIINFTSYIKINFGLSKRIYIKCLTPYQRLGDYTINCTKNFEVGGNVMSLIYGDNFFGKDELLQSWSLSNLLRTKDYYTLIYANKLVLPAQKFQNSTYVCMFFGQKNLLLPPIELPNIKRTLLSCVNLYGHMFDLCSSLITTPIIKNEIYYQDEYESMFKECYNIKTCKIYSKKIIENNKTTWWGLNATRISNGTFLLPIDVEWNPEDYRGKVIPVGWEIKYFNPGTDEIIN